MRVNTTRLAAALCLALAGTSCKAPQAETAAPELEKASDEQRAMYALGVMLGRNVSQWKLSDEDLRFVAAGLADAAQGKPARVDLATYGKRLGELERARVSQAAVAEKEKARAFVEKQAHEPGAERLPSGLVFFDLRPGTGDGPSPTDRVVVQYRGTLADGTEFDSSYKRGQPIDFVLSQVIPCWTEGLQRMKVGGKARLVCPSEIAYGDAGRPPQIAGGAALVFEVELLGLAPAERAGKAAKP